MFHVFSGKFQTANKKNASQWLFFFCIPPFLSWPHPSSNDFSLQKIDKHGKTQQTIKKMIFKRVISRVQSARKFTSHYDLHSLKHPNGCPNAPATGNGAYAVYGFAAVCVYQYVMNMKLPRSGNFEFVKEFWKSGSMFWGRNCDKN